MALAFRNSQMNASRFSQADIPLLTPSLLKSLSSDPSLFHACWRLMNCESCLSTQHPCSWCSVSQVCVPNTHLNYPFAILAPIKHEDICPLTWRERWEMRAKPFSCRCSTITLMSVIIAVLSTLAGLLFIYLAILTGGWLVKEWKGRKDGWWRIWRWRPAFHRWRAAQKPHGTVTDEERRPLLESE